MHRLAFVLFALLVGIEIVCACEEQDWNSFKLEFNKNYGTVQEEVQRRTIYCQNFDMISSHNERYKRGEVTFEMGVNQFTDWTQVEFREWLTGGPPGPLYTYILQNKRK